MRAMLCASDRHAPDKSDLIFGEGIAKLNRPIAEILFELIEPWVDRFGKLDIVMAGMVGSNIGWRTTQYLNCPTPLANLAEYAEIFEHSGHNISILPGVRCHNAMGQPDLMRGEELQILGWIASNPDAAQEERLFCLPGTHTKWARLSHGQIESFTTALTGELFGVLQRHSILLPKQDVVFAQPFSKESFLNGVNLIGKQPYSLLHALFSTRTRLLTDPEGSGDAPSYLSGLLIGSDVKTAIENCSKPGVKVEIIGEQSLAEKYGFAIKQLGHDYHISDGVDAVYAGFMAL
ncbi:hypothetical protein LPB140_03550 [Sphingorhabdus lutea]|uniref:2-dehydro-3-deoxygalactonokinase n=2 Tax=Sphingorhabdus lutea TaxID=1913578 RepID=A0A1L3JA88_9SPHN|nr:hypothetical protein LPB140_03550 [Sphingorhabdus lutea]